MTSTILTTLASVLMALVIAVGRSSTADAASAGMLETPVWNGPHTGISLISGWHCTARKVEIRIDDGELRAAASGTSREDTRAVCGRADTGFGLLFNFSLLEPGQHRVTAYADGIAFAEQVFRTIRFGPSFVSGKRGWTRMLNFPEVGLQTTLRWTEELQNFGAGLVHQAPDIAGDYYGATVRRDCHRTYEARNATYSVAFDGSSMAVAIRYADGETVNYPPASAALDDAGYVRATYGQWTFRANGERLTADTSPLFDYCLILPEVLAAK